MVWKLEKRYFRAAPPEKWPFFAQKWPKIANFGQKSSVSGLGCSVQGPPTLIFRYWTQKNVLHGIEAREWVFQARPTQKLGIFCQKKWPKNVNIGPKTLFPGLGRSVQGPPNLFRTWLTQRNINCMVWKPENKCFRAAPPYKWPLFGQKWPTIANFWQKGSVFGLGCSVQGPRTLLLRCWTPKNMYCMALKLENGCFRAAPPKKSAFLPKKGLKMPKLALKHCFLGLGGQFKALQPYFAGA